jgi:hypothetical protein
VAHAEAATAQELAGRQLAAMRAEIAALNQNLRGGVQVAAK